jgi:hypothetical protein
MAAVMYRQSSRAASQNASTHLHLQCGKQFNGSGRQVSKLVDLHRRVCKRCSNTQEICIGYKKQTVNDSHVWNAMKISANIERQIESMPSMSGLDKIYNRSFAEFATKDCMFNSDKWTTATARKARTEDLRHQHEAWFRQMVDKSRKK